MSTSIPMPTSEGTPREFDLAGPLPEGMSVLEASAGTGKTYTLTALVARYVAEGRVEIGQLLMMTFTRAAAAEMRDRTRSRLVEVRDALAAQTPVGDGWLGAIVDGSARELEQRHQRVVAALAALDDASITTIHGFCQQTLHELGVVAGDIAASEVSERSDGLVASLVRDELIRTLGREPDALGPIGDRSLATVEKELLGVVKATLSNQGVERAPLDPPVGSTERAWTEIVDRIIDAVAVSRLRSGSAGFDDLITGVGAIVDDPRTSGAVITRMRERFRLVLIDEFQDTDTVQWNILSRLFVAPHPGTTEPVVICVGDPKQAIYRFRGADIDAYLRAIDESGAQRSDLRTNFRADRRLVTATNELMRGLDLGRGRIPYVEVHAASSAPECATSDGISLDIRWLPESVPLRGQRKQSAGTVRERIAADLGDEVVRLLGTELDLGDETRTVEPGDIAVLLRANDDALPVLEALRERRVPTVQARIGSVTTSEAMDQLRLLAAALANPSDLRRVRALGLGWFVAGSESVAVAIDDERANAALQQRCDRWADELREHGIVAFLEHLRSDSELLGSLAVNGQLERGLTDLEHIVELVHRRTKGLGVSGAVLARLLGEIAGTDETSEIEQRRTDTDSTSVLLTSMHGAKGLEYPIVLVPYPKGIRNTSPFLFTIDGRRFVDTAPVVDWADQDSDQKLRKARALTEIEEDERRLIYVALTRPKHRLTVWWGQSSGVEKGSLARVLFHDPDASGPFAAPKGDDAVRSALEALQARVGPAMALTELGPQSFDAPPRYERPRTDLTGARVSAIPASAAPRTDWFRWSFSSMAEAVGGHGSLDEVRAGHDEGDPAAETATAPAESAPDLVGDLLGLPASAAFGVLVHDVLEAADFSVSDPTAELHRLVTADPRTVALGASPDLLASGLAAVLATPLTGLADGHTLADLTRGERLAEVGFHLPIGDGAGPLRRAAFVDAAIEHEPSAIAAAFAEIRDSWSDATVRGLLTGSIDALFRFDDRYFVVDYKTNRLHPPGSQATAAHYGRAAMFDAMCHHRYLLQALVYSVATHRFLATRLAGYDPERHLGGAGYLFVRGMTGPSTPVIDGTACGVFTWQPAVTTILETDRAIGGTR